MFPLLNCMSATYPNYSAHSNLPNQQSTRPVIDNNTIRFKNSLADLKHELSNHEAEIRIFENKLHNQESSLDQIRQQIVDDLEGQREYTRAMSINLEGKIDTLDKAVNGLMNDLRQLKNHANDSVNVLAQYKQKLIDVEKILEAQDQHISSLEVALHSLIDVWQARETATQEIANKQVINSSKTYKVQPGDSLEKIAKANKTTVKILRECNQLTSDLIVVGQVLKLP
uniref:LysM peptidoglycan-binding domain-containing protein n=1 Tax=Candidatus Protochlamydia sp. R18 TaxID=1353977 RepID=UPI000AF8A957|nr:LysM peptidoglycan-binding domain-containing protein [Candidatus Protochlamydia sp. R18]